MKYSIRRNLRQTAMQGQPIQQHRPPKDAFGFFELANIPAMLFDNELNPIRVNKPFRDKYLYQNGVICGEDRDQASSTSHCHDASVANNSVKLEPFLSILSGDAPQLCVNVTLGPDKQHQLRFTLAPNNTRLLTLHDLDESSDEYQKLEQLSETLHWANKDLAEFSHAATHDLRSPLRAMRTIPDWIRSDLQESIGGVPDEVSQHLEMMRQQADRLENMLDGLLTYTQIGRYDDASQPISLLQTLNQLRMDLVLPKDFSLQLPAQDKLLRVPEHELRLALHSLIDNAVRHHHMSTGRVWVETDCPKEQLLICVVDDGPGIPVQYHQTVLKTFSTLHSRDIREGSGMGLPITHKIVRHWGGTLSIDTEADGQGTRVTMAVPTERCVA